MKKTCMKVCKTWVIFWIITIDISGVNGKPVYHISFRLGRNDEIRKEYLRTGY